MISDYITATLRHARYELMEKGRIFDSIPECQGCWAEAATLEECRVELQSTLEEWLLLGLQMGHPQPVVDGIDLLSSENCHSELVEEFQSIRA